MDLEGKSGMARTITVELRNGEKRVYKDITRIEDKHPTTIRLYWNDKPIAHLNKRDVVAIRTPAA
jgi:hypothetical protein